MNGHTPNLGEAPAEGAPRDAIHIAVIPAMAGTDLYPSDRVGIDKDGKARWTDNIIGVVDPFRDSSVAEGERFWLFMKPLTVQNLRHQWTHPVFPNPDQTLEDTLTSLRVVEALHPSPQPEPEDENEDRCSC